MYTKNDIETFDKLLTQAESKGFDNYNRIVGRLDLQKFLSKFTKEEQDEMAQKIGASRKG